MVAFRHTLFEDLCAFTIGTVMISIGLVFLHAGGLMTGGTAGLSLLINYVTNVPIEVSFFLLNIPFYVLALRSMGGSFTAICFLAVATVSVMTKYHAGFLHLSGIDPVYAAVTGNLMLGVGMLILLRHSISIGGVGILSIYLSERLGVRVGYMQLFFDASILLASLAVVPGTIALFSLGGSFLLNGILAMNFRKDRYPAHGLVVKTRGEK
ncbi:YitT family protein [Pseudomonas putida]|uniref:YitT family protein n=1 Tax=Pseudomonas putida TaxID=303 RepID=UPI0013747C08|nr:YitT family protein [Pseudomonas putida]